MKPIHQLLTLLGLAFILGLPVELSAQSSVSPTESEREATQAAAIMTTIGSITNVEDTLRIETTISPDNRLVVRLQPAWMRTPIAKEWFSLPSFLVSRPGWCILESKAGISYTRVWIFDGRRRVSGILINHDRWVIQPPLPMEPDMVREHAPLEFRLRVPVQLGGLDVRADTL